MPEIPCGRDVFVAGAANAAEVAAQFANAFGLLPAHAITEAAPFQELLDALAHDRIVVYALEPGGDFPFKVAMDFHRPIDVNLFAGMARAHGLRIAYAVDESAARDDAYHVVTPAGTMIRRLGFDETAASYACNLIGPRQGGP